MRIPRWLLPVVAIVAAGAVAVAAVLIGMKFAPTPPASAFVPPATETAQVLQPLPGSATEDGAEAPPADSGDGDSAVPPGASPISGETEVAVAEDDPAATDREVLRLVDLVGLSPDLLGGLFHLLHDTTDDDPCAPRDGAPAGDCPAGAPGTVLYDGDIPPLWLTVDAWAQTHAAARTTLGPAFAPMTCDPAAAADGSVDIRIRVTAPGTWNVRYWPDDRPGEVQTIDPVSASTAQGDTWSHESLDVEHGRYIIEHCVRLPDIEPGTPYTLEVTGTDVFGRDPGPHSIHFHSDGPARHPGLTVQPIGQNLMLVTAPHTPGETVTIKPYLITEGTDETSCSTPGAGAELSPVTYVDHVAVGDEERRRINATSDVTEKMVYSYRVPEGATVLVCGRWFPGAEAPTWESDQSTFESSLVVQSPDRNLPRVDFQRFDARDDRTVSLTWSIATTQGMICGTGTWNTGDPLPSTLCRSNFLNTGGATAEGAGPTGAERIADRGFTNDLVLRVDATLESGETSETTVELPAGAGSCTGDCPLPPPDSFGVATIGGTMMLRRTWETGLQSGLADWSVGASADRAVDYVAPDQPQIDTRAGWTYSRPGFRPTVAGSIDIPVDRPVTWTLAARTDGSTYGIGCGATPAPVTPTGRTTDGHIRISLADLCLGGQYEFSLRLEDGDGNVAVWGATDRSAWWPTGAIAVVPSLPVTMRWRVDDAAGNRDFIHRMAILLDGYDVPIANNYADPVGSRCVRPDGLVMSEGRIDTFLRAYPTIGYVFQSGPRRPGTTCDAFALDEVAEPFSTRVDITRLGAVDGVVLSSADAGATVHLWFDAR